MAMDWAWKLTCAHGRVGPPLALGLLAALPSPAMAESDAGPAVDTIVVTAQRRPENGQQIPLSLTALGELTLREQGVHDVTALDAAVPGLQVSGNGSGIVEIAVRGIGSTNNSEVGDPAVAYNQDGVYMARSRSISGPYYDLERIEVLRGPQGTLYGRNATAGTINVISHKPVDRLEAAATGEIGNGGLFRSELMANVPVADQLMFRGAFTSLNRQGFYDTPPYHNYGDVEALAGRAWALARPIEKLSILVGYDIYHDGGGGGINQLLPVGPGGEPFFQPMFARDGSIDHTNKGLTGQVDLDLGAVTLTYLGSSRHDRLDARTGSNNPALPLLQTHHQSNEDQNSHELRVAYSSEILKVVAGLYRFRESDDVTFGAFNVPGYGTIHFIQPDVRVKSKAAFGQATIEPVRGTRVTGGIRYTIDDKGRSGGTYLFLAETPQGSDHLTCFGGDDISPCEVFPNEAQHRWKNTSFRLAVDHDVSGDVMAYASVTTGYKAGGYNDGPAPFDSPYDAEQVTAYEAGLKSRFADDRVQANLSLFWYDYKDLQVSGIAAVFGQPSLVTINAAKARNYGGELEFTAVPGDHDRIDGSITWLHARFTDFLLPCGDQYSPATPNPAPGCPAGSPAPVDYDGNRLAKAPDWTFSIGYERPIDLTSGLHLTPRLQTHFESAKNLDYHNFPVSRQGSYWKSDAMLTLAPARGRWSLMAYAHNIFDKAYLVRAVPIASPIPDRNSADGVWGDPRRFGLQLSFKFD